MGGLEYYFSPPKGFNVARARTFAHTQFCTCVEAITLLPPLRCSIHDLSLMSNLRYHSFMAFSKMFFIIIYFRTLSSIVSVSETCYCFCWLTALLWCWRSLFFSSSLTMKALEEKLVPGISILQLCVWTVWNTFDLVSSISQMNSDDMFSVRCSNAISSSKVSFCTQIKLILLESIFPTADSLLRLVNVKSFSLKTISLTALETDDSNCLLQILKLHMVLFKLEIIQANNKLCFTGKNQINITLLNYLKYSKL